MTTNDNSTTRRTVIAGLLAAPAATAIAALPAVAAPIGESLSAKIAAHARSEAAHVAFDRNEVGEVAARSKAAKTAWKKACEAIPHYTCKTGYEAEGDKVVFMTTEGPQAAISRIMLKSMTDPDRVGDYFEASRELVAAEAKREDERKRLAKVHGLSELEAEWAAINERSRALGKLAFAAEDAVLQHRAASIAEMAEKLAFAVKVMADAEDILPPLLADAQRLARREAV